ncbi:MAG: hypothetical protein ABH883_07600, partial [Candidatus Omnitrophota bacterium]
MDTKVQKHKQMIKKIRRAGKKFTAILSAASFLFSVVLFPGVSGAITTDIVPYPAISMYRDINSDTREAVFELPQSLGHVQDMFLGDKPGMVIQIQDAHCDYYAQTSIKKIVRFFKEEYGVMLLCLEGGAGAYDLSAFHNIEDKGVRRRVTDFFVKQGVLNGAEAASAEDPGAFVLWGVEDPLLYKKNLDVYRRSAKYKAETMEILGGLKAVIDNLKKKIYSGELYGLDQEYNGYKNDEIQFKEYILSITGRAQQQVIPLKSLPNIYILRQVLEEEDKIDFKKANKDRDLFIENIRAGISHNRFSELVEKTIRFKSGDLPQKDYYNYLLEAGREAGVDISNYPDLQRYVIYISLYTSVDKTALMAEIEKLEDILYKSYCVNEPQRRLVDISKKNAVMRKAFEFSMTKYDFKYFQENLTSLDISGMVSFLEKQAMENGITAPVPKKTADLAENLKEIEMFYIYSFDRDKVFIEKMKQEREESGFENTILVTGGFHTENLTALLRGENISYVSILPDFTDPWGYESPYFSLLGGEPSGFAKTVKDAVYSAAMQVASIWNMLGRAVAGETEQALADIQVLIAESLTRSGEAIVEVDNKGKKSVIRFLMDNSGRVTFVSAENQAENSVANVKIRDINSMDFMDANAIIDFQLSRAYDEDVRKAAGEKKRVTLLNAKGAARLSPSLGKVVEFLEALSSRNADLGKIAAKIRSGEIPVSSVSGIALFKGHASWRGIHVKEEMDAVSQAGAIMHEIGAYYMLGHDDNRKLEELCAAFAERGIASIEASRELDVLNKFGGLKRHLSVRSEAMEKEELAARDAAAPLAASSAPAVKRVKALEGATYDGILDSAVTDIPVQLSNIRADLSRGGMISDNTIEDVKKLLINARFITAAQDREKGLYEILSSVEKALREKGRYYAGAATPAQKNDFARKTGPVFSEIRGLKKDLERISELKGQGEAGKQGLLEHLIKYAKAYLEAPVEGLDMALTKAGFIQKKVDTLGTEIAGVLENTAETKINMLYNSVMLGFSMDEAVAMIDAFDFGGAEIVERDLASRAEKLKVSGIDLTSGTDLAKRTGGLLRSYALAAKTIEETVRKRKEMLDGYPREIKQKIMEAENLLKGKAAYIEAERAAFAAARYAEDYSSYAEKNLDYPGIIAAREQKAKADELFSLTKKATAERADALFKAIDGKKEEPFEAARSLEQLYVLLRGAKENAAARNEAPGFYDGLLSRAGTLKTLVEAAHERLKREAVAELENAFSGFLKNDLKTALISARKAAAALEGIAGNRVENITDPELKNMAFKLRDLEKNLKVKTGQFEGAMRMSIANIKRGISSSGKAGNTARGKEFVFTAVENFIKAADFALMARKYAIENEDNAMKLEAEGRLREAISKAIGELKVLESFTAHSREINDSGRYMDLACKVGKAAGKIAAEFGETGENDLKEKAYRLWTASARSARSGITDKITEANAKAGRGMLDEGRKISSDIIEGAIRTLAKIEQTDIWSDVAEKAGAADRPEELRKDMDNFIFAARALNGKMRSVSAEAEKAVSSSVQAARDFLISGNYRDAMTAVRKGFKELEKIAAGESLRDKLAGKLRAERLDVADFIVYSVSAGEFDVQAARDLIDEIRDDAGSRGDVRAESLAGELSRKIARLQAKKEGLLRKAGYFLERKNYFSAMDFADAEMDLAVSGETVIYPERANAAEKMKTRVRSGLLSEISAKAAEAEKLLTRGEYTRAERSARKALSLIREAERRSIEIDPARELALRAGAVEEQVRVSRESADMALRAAREDMDSLKISEAVAALAEGEAALADVSEKDEMFMAKQELGRLRAAHEAYLEVYSESSAKAAGIEAEQKKARRMMTPEERSDFISETEKTALTRGVNGLLSEAEKNRFSREKLDIILTRANDMVRADMSGYTANTTKQLMNMLLELSGKYVSPEWMDFGRAVETGLMAMGLADSAGYRDYVRGFLEDLAVAPLIVYARSIMERSYKLTEAREYAEMILDKWDGENKQAGELIREIRKKTVEAGNLYDSAAAYLAEGDYFMAMKAAEKALSYAENNGDNKKAGKAEALTDRIGRDLKAAIASGISSAERLLEEKNYADARKAVRSALKMSGLYGETVMSDQARTLLDKIQRDIIREAGNLNRGASRLREEGKADEAVIMAEKARDLARDLLDEARAEKMGQDPLAETTLRFSETIISKSLKDIEDREHNETARKLAEYLQKVNDRVSTGDMGLGMSFIEFLDNEYRASPGIFPDMAGAGNVFKPFSGYIALAVSGVASGDHIKANAGIMGLRDFMEANRGLIDRVSADGISAENKKGMFIEIEKLEKTLTRMSADKGLSAARDLISNHEYGAAEALLRSVLTVDGDNRRAMELMRGIPGKIRESLKRLSADNFEDRISRLLRDKADTLQSMYNGIGYNGDYDASRAEKDLENLIFEKRALQAKIAGLNLDMIEERESRNSTYLEKLRTRKKQEELLRLAEKSVKLMKLFQPVMESMSSAMTAELLIDFSGEGFIQGVEYGPDNFEEFIKKLTGDKKADKEALRKIDRFLESLEANETNLLKLRSLRPVVALPGRLYSVGIRESSGGFKELFSFDYVYGGNLNLFKEILSFSAGFVRARLEGKAKEAYNNMRSALEKAGCEYKGTYDGGRVYPLGQYNAYQAADLAATLKRVNAELAALEAKALPGGELAVKAAAALSEEEKALEALDQRGIDSAMADEIQQRDSSLERMGEIEERIIALESFLAEVELKDILREEMDRIGGIRVREEDTLNRISAGLLSEGKEKDLLMKDITGLFDRLGIETAADINEVKERTAQSLLSESGEAVFAARGTGMFLKIFIDAEGKVDFDVDFDRAGVPAPDAVKTGSVDNMDFYDANKIIDAQLTRKYFEDREDPGKGIVTELTKDSETLKNVASFFNDIGLAGVAERISPGKGIMSRILSKARPAGAIRIARVKGLNMIDGHASWRGLNMNADLNGEQLEKAIVHEIGAYFMQEHGLNRKMEELYTRWKKDADRKNFSRKNKEAVALFSGLAEGGNLKKEGYVPGRDAAAPASNGFVDVLVENQVNDIISVQGDEKGGYLAANKKEVAEAFISILREVGKMLPGERSEDIARSILEAPEDIIEELTLREKTYSFIEAVKGNSRIWDSITRTRSISPDFFVEAGVDNSALVSDVVDELSMELEEMGEEEIRELDWKAFVEEFKGRNTAGFIKNSFFFQKNILKTEQAEKPGIEEYGPLGNFMPSPETVGSIKISRDSITGLKDGEGFTVKFTSEKAENLSARVIESLRERSMGNPFVAMPDELAGYLAECQVRTIADNSSLTEFFEPESKTLYITDKMKTISGIIPEIIPVIILTQAAERGVNIPGLYNRENRGISQRMALRGLSPERRVRLGEAVRSLRNNKKSITMARVEKEIEKMHPVGAAEAGIFRAYTAEERRLAVQNISKIKVDLEDLSERGLISKSENYGYGLVGQLYGGDEKYGAVRESLLKQDNTNPMKHDLAGAVFNARVGAWVCFADIMAGRARAQYMGETVMDKARPDATVRILDFAVKKGIFAFHFGSDEHAFMFPAEFGENEVKNFFLELTEELKKDYDYSLYSIREEDAAENGLTAEIEALSGARGIIVELVGKNYNLLIPSGESPEKLIGKLVDSKGKILAEKKEMFPFVLPVGAVKLSDNDVERVNAGKEEKRVTFAEMEKDAEKKAGKKWTDDEVNTMVIKELAEKGITKSDADWNKLYNRKMREVCASIWSGYGNAGGVPGERSRAQQLIEKLARRKWEKLYGAADIPEDRFPVIMVKDGLIGLNKDLVNVKRVTVDDVVPEKEAHESFLADPVWAENANKIIKERNSRNIQRILDKAKEKTDAEIKDAKEYEQTDAYTSYDSKVLKDLLTAIFTLSKEDIAKLKPEERIVMVRGPPIDFYIIMINNDGRVDIISADVMCHAEGIVDKNIKVKVEEQLREGLGDRRSDYVAFSKLPEDIRNKLYASSPAVRDFLVEKLKNVEGREAQMNVLHQYGIRVFPFKSMNDYMTHNVADDYILASSIAVYEEFWKTFVGVDGLYDVAEMDTADKSGELEYETGVFGGAGQISAKHKGMGISNALMSSAKKINSTIIDRESFEAKMKKPPIDIMLESQWVRGGLRGVNDPREKNPRKAAEKFLERLQSLRAVRDPMVILDDAMVLSTFFTRKGRKISFPGARLRSYDESGARNAAEKKRIEGRIKAYKEALAAKKEAERREAEETLGDKNEFILLQAAEEKSGVKKERSDKKVLDIYKESRGIVTNIYDFKSPLVVAIPGSIFTDSQYERVGKKVVRYLRDTYGAENIKVVFYEDKDDLADKKEDL